MHFIFTSSINDRPCKIKVLHYIPYQPARGLSGPPEDAEESIPSEFEYQVLNMQGEPWQALQDWIDEPTHERLQEEYEAALLAEKHGRDF